MNPSNNFDFGDFTKDALPWAQLVAQTFVANQAITSPRPSTISLAPNGQLLTATGGGATTLTTNLGGISPTILLLGVGLIFVLLLMR